MKSKSYKIFSALVVFQLAYALRGQAGIVDESEDGMSDVWQKEYNIPDGDRDSDLDHDGWPNWVESIFGTNPNVNGAPNLYEDTYGLPHLDARGTYPEVSWGEVKGIPYVIERSENLEIWESVYGPVVGENYGLSVISMDDFPVVIHGNQFFRLRAEESTDSDGDGLNAYEEFLLGSSDALDDSDGDEMPDLWEFIFNLQINFDDSALDPDLDGYSNLIENQKGTNPQDSTSVPIPIISAQDRYRDFGTVRSCEFETDGFFSASVSRSPPQLGIPVHEYGIFDCEISTSELIAELADPMLNPNPVTIDSTYAINNMLSSDVFTTEDPGWSGSKDLDQISVSSFRGSSVGGEPGFPEVFWNETRIVSDIAPISNLIMKFLKITEVDPSDSENWTVESVEVVELQINPGETESLDTVINEPTGGDAEKRRQRIKNVNLTIYNGNAVTVAVRESDEESVGAFTVANLNDTDGDGTTDKNDTSVKQSAAGRDERDLMKLVIEAPSGIPGNLVLTRVSGTVKIWEQRTKEIEIPLTSNKFEFPASQSPYTVWIEGTAVSNTVRDIEFKVGWEESPGTLHDDLDSVKATAIWATNTDKHFDPSDTLWNEAGDPLRTNFNQSVQKFGKNFNSITIFIHYTIGFEFTVMPSGLQNHASIIKFDIGRQKEQTEWAIQGSQTNPQNTPWDTFPPRVDESNDDVGNGDEDLTPRNDHLYSFDGPAVQKAAHPLVDEYIKRANFFEFVRVSFTGSAPGGNNDNGSRCSPKEPWHMWMWLDSQGPLNQEKPGEINQVAPGHLTLTPQP